MWNGFKKYYVRLIADIRKSALNDNLRGQIQYRYILKLLLVVTVVSSVVNLLTERYTMGLLMLILGSIYFMFYWIVYKLKDKGVRIVSLLMIILSLLLCTIIMIRGTTGGVAPIWILLFPILALLLLGRRLGSISSLIMLGIMVFLYWTPVGRSMLGHEYEEIFMERYPFVYFVMFVMSFFYETFRSTMVDELLTQRKQMEYVYRNQYHSMGSRIAEAKKIRHDLRHHFLMINEYLRYEEISEAQQYIDRYYKTLPFEEALTYCEHYATNALLTYYVQLAKEHGITITVSLNMPDKIAIGTEDLTVVLGNLLENAVDASVSGIETDDGFEPWIKINGEYTENVLTLSISNAFKQEICINERGQFLSTKHEGPGIGVHSVRDMVEKYNGEFTVSHSGGIFLTELIMNAPDS